MILRVGRKSLKWTQHQIWLGSVLGKHLREAGGDFSTIQLTAGPCPRPGSVRARWWDLVSCGKSCGEKLGPKDTLPMCLHLSIRSFIHSSDGGPSMSKTVL